MGVDPNASIDDVTEEEIISMVNEGHVQGVLQASEAEMIHNIFAFDDKEAKDIMTRAFADTTLSHPLTRSVREFRQAGVSGKFRKRR